MEDTQNFISDCFKCVRYHVTTWSNNAMHEVTNLTNVDDYVTAEVAANDALRTRIAEISARSEERRLAMNTVVASAERETADMRRQYAERAKPMLQAYDALSLSKHYYSEILNLIGQQQYGATQLQARETDQYGYQSKRLISLGLTLEALREKVDGGKPFARELRALVEDADSPDIGLVSAPLESVAGVGLAPQSALRDSAGALARSMEDSAKRNPTVAAQSWFDWLKFRSVLQPGASQTQQMQVAMARDTAKLFLSHVDKKDWASALQLADNKFDKMTTSNTAQVHHVHNLNAFKKIAYPHVAASQFLQYAEASMASARLAFVESILKIE